MISLSWVVPLGAGDSGSQDLAGVLGAVVEHIDLEKGLMSVRVSNNSEKAVTAWAIQVAVRATDGTVTTFRSEEDGYMYTDVRPLLAAGASRVVPVGVGQPGTVVDAAVTPVAAVFEDTSCAGDPAIGALILARRAAERDEMLYWKEVLKTALIQNSPETVLPDGTRVGNLSAAEKSSVSLQTLATVATRESKMRSFTQVASLLQEAGRTRMVDKFRGAINRLTTTDGPNFDVSVEKFVKLLEIEYTNAVKHTRES